MNLQAAEQSFILEGKEFGNLPGQGRLLKGCSGPKDIAKPLVGGRVPSPIGL